MAADCCGWAKFVHRVSHTRSIWLNMKCHPETDRLHSRARRMTTTMNSSQLCPLWLCCHNNHEQCADRENYTPNLYKHSAPITQTTSYTHTIYRSSIQPAGAIYNLVLICKDDLTTTTTKKYTSYGKLTIHKPKNAKHSHTNSTYAMLQLKICPSKHKWWWT